MLFGQRRDEVDQSTCWYMEHIAHLEVSSNKRKNCRSALRMCEQLFLHTRLGTAQQFAHKRLYVQCRWLYIKHSNSTAVLTAPATAPADLLC